MGKENKNPSCVGQILFWCQTEKSLFDWLCQQSSNRFLHREKKIIFPKFNNNKIALTADSLPLEQKCLFLKTENDLLSLVAFTILVTKQKFAKVVIKEY